MVEGGGGGGGRGRGGGREEGDPGWTRDNFINPWLKEGGGESKPLRDEGGKTLCGGKFD